VSEPVKTLVALDAGANRDAVEAVIPVQASIELVAIVDGLEAGWEALNRQSIDAVVVACTGDAEYALTFIDGVARDHPDLPMMPAVVGEMTPSMAAPRSGSSNRYGPSVQLMSMSSGSRVRRDGTIAMSSKP
jgi:hypothetical protein